MPNFNYKRIKPTKFYDMSIMLLTEAREVADLNKQTYLWFSMDVTVVN